MPTANYEISPGVSSLATGYKGLLLDAYGVFWGGNEVGLLPGSKEVMEALVSRGMVIGILSNTTQLASKEIQKYERAGLIQGVHYHFLITSGEIIKLMLINEKLPFETSHKLYFLLGGDHPRYSSHRAVFEGSAYCETFEIALADFIYISIPHLDGEDQTDQEKFRPLVQNMVKTHLPMICPNPDRFAHEGSPPRAVVRQGSIAKLYEEMGGNVFYIGKPDSRAYTLAMNHFEKHGLYQPREILMVGDTPETDIRGARRFGIPSALVTQTGIMAERVIKHGLKHALEMLSAEDVPNHLIERLQDDI